MRIGFVGLGQMGYQMAARLFEAGFELLVSDVDIVRAAEFVEAYGGGVLSSPQQWSDVDTLILMLPDSNVVETVLLGDAAVTDSLTAGTLIIDMSSSEPMRTRAVSERMTALGFRFMDAPVSGGVVGAKAGSLAIMVGGDPADLEANREMFDVLGSKIFQVGPAGAGHAAKALNNLVSAATFAVTSEALHVGEKFGIDPHLLNAVFNASSGRSNTSEKKIEQFVLSGTFGSGFGLGLMAKDVHIAIGLAEQVGQEVPVGRVSEQVWSRAASATDRATDHTAMYTFLA
jgi:3-hydroxyisobutyrate dehydrogenase